MDSNNVWYATHALYASINRRSAFAGFQVRALRNKVAQARFAASMVDLYTAENATLAYLDKCLARRVHHA